MSTATLQPAPQATPAADAIQTLHIQRDASINASADVVWESLLDELGPEGQLPDGKPYPRIIEAWPGGRWYRDLGNNAGHFWGHVQVIKPPTLLEITGPLFMSYPAISHVQYRLTDKGNTTQLTLVHSAIGLIAKEHREGVSKGWTFILERIRDFSHARAGSSRKPR